MKPISKPVTTANGRLMLYGSVVLKRISLTIGDNATPKKAVLMWVENGCPRQRAYSATPAMMNQTLSRFLPNSPKPSTRNSAAMAAPVIRTRFSA